MTLASPTAPGSTDALEAARLFLDDLEVDAGLRAAWNALDANDQSLSQTQRSAAVDAFLSAHGYPATAADLSTVLAQPADPATLPNGDAVQFAIRLFSEGALRKDWDAAVTAVAAGPEPDLAPVNALLAREKVNANAVQVVKAVAAAGNGGLGTWVGSYGDTGIASGTSRFPGPTLIVTGSYVSLDTHRIVGETFDTATQTLSWTPQDGMNATAGSVTFSRRSDPTPDDAYLGNTFSGTLTLPAKGFALSGTVSFTGRVAPPRQQPPSTTNQDIENIKNAAAVVAVVVSGATVLTLAYRFRKFLSRRWEEVRTRYRRWRGEQGEALDTEIAYDLELGEIDMVLGFRKYAEMGRLRQEFEALSPEEQLRSAGQEVLDRLQKVRESLTEEERDAFEAERGAMRDFFDGGE